MNNSPSNTPPTYKKYRNTGIRDAIAAACKLIRKRFCLLIVSASSEDRANRAGAVVAVQEKGDELAYGPVRTSRSITLIKRRLLLDPHQRLWRDCCADCRIGAKTNPGEKRLPLPLCLSLKICLGGAHHEGVVFGR
jgi:hypothetical protein